MTRRWWIEPEDRVDDVTPPAPASAPDRLARLKADRDALIRRRLMRGRSLRKSIDRDLVRATAAILREELRRP